MNCTKMFDDHCSKIRESCQFVVKPILHNGALFDAFGGDDNILRLLSFKGTGEKKKFREIQEEYATYSNGWWDNLLNTGIKPESNNLKWIDEFVIGRQEK